MLYNIYIFIYIYKYTYIYIYIYTCIYIFTIYLLAIYLLQLAIYISICIIRYGLKIIVKPQLMMTSESLLVPISHRSDHRTYFWN